MTYLLDTDFLISAMENDANTLPVYERLFGEGLSISCITYMEALQGVLAIAGRSEDDFQDFIGEIDVLPIDRAIASRCATIRLILAQQGKRVRQRGFDLLIATTAIEHGLILVTRNVDDFKDVPGLKLYFQQPQIS